MERTGTKREAIVDKIRALLAKTTANGCTEEEALSALDKARAMMDAYEVTEDDLQLSREETAVLHKEENRDPHKIRMFLGSAIADFCDCRVWRGDVGLVFCGMQSDAQLATYLMESLASFVQAELANHLMGCIAPKGERRFVINGFVAGCTSRIAARMRELIKQSATVATSNGRALVVIKSGAVKAKMDELGIKLGSGRRSSRRVDHGSYRAGVSAGDRANFGRPVSGSAAALRLTKHA